MIAICIMISDYFRVYYLIVFKVKSLNWKSRGSIPSRSNNNWRSQNRSRHELITLKLSNMSWVFLEPLSMIQLLTIYHPSITKHRYLIQPPLFHWSIWISLHQSSALSRTLSQEARAQWKNLLLWYLIKCFDLHWSISQYCPTKWGERLYRWSRSYCCWLPFV